MTIGHQLVKEQLFFRRELRERIHWFIKLRWIAVAGGFGATCLLSAAAPQFSVLPLNVVIIAVLLYNILFLFIWLRLDSFESHRVRPFEIFAHIQIFFDLSALFFLIGLTGGIYSPLIIFVIFHIIIAGILLSTASCFTYSSLVVLSFILLIVLQSNGTLPIHPTLFQKELFPLAPDFPATLFQLLTLTAFIMISAFLITSIRSSLRTKGRELLKVSKELNRSNTKLTTLYDMVKEMGSLYDLQSLMDSATRNSAIIMGVKGSSIKLLDNQRKKMKLSSKYGISEELAVREDMNVENNPVYLKFTKRDRVTINRPERDNSEYMEYIENEGIASILCLPLRIEKMVSGALCIYSEKPNCFEKEDVAFFSLIADLTALGIEKITRELTKRWFLAKAAHQLRSPLNAIYSMLDLIQKGYQGTLNKEQRETIQRCSTRIKILGETVNDLLKIDIRRTDGERGGTGTATLVDVKELLQDIATLYTPRASEKGVNLKFDIDSSAPQIGVNRQLLDDLFSNIISNAIKYTPQGGYVTVMLSVQNGHQIHFQVADTGIGIPDKDMANLFSEFFRAENAKSFTENGTGLGLIIVKEILDILQGSISVESKPGEGTRVTCYFPVNDIKH